MMTVAKSQSYKNLRQSPQLSFYSTMQLPLISPFFQCSSKLGSTHASTAQMLQYYREIVQSKRFAQSRYTLTASFIHSGYFYSTSSSPLLLRGAPDTALILCRSFTPKHHKQL